jgi:hypothetical protein
MAEIVFESRSGAERFALHLRARPGEYDRHQVAAILGIAPGAVDTTLQPAVDAAVITIANDGDAGRVWRTGPRMGAWKLAAAPGAVAEAAQASSPASAPASAPARKSNRGGRRPGLPVLKLDAVKVSTNLPLPAPRMSRKGESRHDQLLGQLTADGMSVTGIPVAYQASLLKAVQTYLDARPVLKKTSALYVRKLEDDEEHIGVWRVSRTGTQAMACSRTAATGA